MKSLQIIIILALLAIGFTACSDTSINVNRSNTVNTTKTAAPAATPTSASDTAANKALGDDADFMAEAAQGGMAEVEMGKLAGTKAQNPEVKKFGAMMVTDHGKAGDELKALAAKKGVTLPADIGSHKSTLDKLNGLSGAGFDKEYIEEMVDDHEADVKAFKDASENAKDPDVKAFAAKVLPVVQKHLDEIKAIQAKMK
jgi:putative membrane protein